VIQSIIWLVV